LDRTTDAFDAIDAIDALIAASKLENEMRNVSI